LQEFFFSFDSNNLYSGMQLANFDHNFKFKNNKIKIKIFIFFWNYLFLEISGVLKILNYLNQINSQEIKNRYLIFLVMQKISLLNSFIIVIW